MGTVLSGDLWVHCSYLTGAESSCRLPLGKAHNVANTQGALMCLNKLYRGPQRSVWYQAVVRSSRFLCVSPQTGVLLGAGVQQRLGLLSDCSAPLLSFVIPTTSHGGSGHDMRRDAQDRGCGSLGPGPGSSAPTSVPSCPSSDNST